MYDLNAVSIGEAWTTSLVTPLYAVYVVYPGTPTFAVELHAGGV